jgi:hypothetical protein
MSETDLFRQPLAVLAGRLPGAQIEAALTLRFACQGRRPGYQGRWGQVSFFICSK